MAPTKQMYKENLPESGLVYYRGKVMKRGEANKLRESQQIASVPDKWVRLGIKRKDSFY